MAPTEVIKRDGRRVEVSFDKILRRISALCGGLDRVDPVRVAQRVVQGVYDGVPTSLLDDLAADAAAALCAQHPQYAALAGRVAVSNLHKMTAPSIAAVYPHLADDVRAFARANEAAVDAALAWERDLRFDIFGFRTLERSYLLRDPDDDRRVVERRR